MRRRARRSRPSATGLAAAGWVLSPALADARQVHAPTAVGTVGSGPIATVDDRGAVQPTGQGWSLDWWVGADDRWHRPAAEGGVRQRLVDAAPVVETLVRIPGGDARHVAYGARSGTEDVVVVEVQNASSIPFALALVVRPFTATGVGDVTTIGLTPTSGGRGRDTAQVVTVDDGPALLLPRAPARSAAGSSATGDVAVAVAEGGAGSAFPGVRDDAGGLATAAFLFPVPHRATLRVVIPCTGGQGWPADLPDASRVAHGWGDQVRRAPRLDVPDTGVLEGVEAVRRALLLAAGGGAELAEAAVLVAALDREGFADEAARVLATWPERLAGRRLAPATAAAVLGAAVGHWRLTRHTRLVEALLPELVTAVRAVERDPMAAGEGAPLALAGLAEVLVAIGQTDAAARIPGHGARHLPAPDPGTAWARLAAARRAASPTWTWGDLAGAMGFVATVRALLVDDRGPGLALLPAGPGPWYRQGVELHEAPTASGRLSFAVRWHGDRPAILWDLHAHPDLPGVEVTAPGLDPSWRTTARQGEELLAPVPPPPDFVPAGSAPAPPAGQGSAEAMAPRSVLPVGRLPTDRRPSPSPPPDTQGGSFS